MFLARPKSRAACETTKYLVGHFPLQLPRTATNKCYLVRRMRWPLIADYIDRRH